MPGIQASTYAATIWPEPDASGKNVHFLHYSGYKVAECHFWPTAGGFTLVILG